MNTRLSQRVYSESALEFWLGRLGADWERQFSELELLQGRQLYRSGAVRQLELGETDAIVHMRLEEVGEVYVVLDWSGAKLSVRASVEDRAQRRLLAVAGLYEVEELVGDEAPALAPDAPAAGAAPDAAATPDTVGGAGAASASTASTTATAAAAQTGGLRSAGGSAATENLDTAVSGGGKSRRAADETAGTAKRSGSGTDAPAAQVAAGGAAANGSASAAGVGVSTGTTAGAGTGTGSATVTGTGAASAAASARQLVLHLKLSRGSLQLQVNWRLKEKGRSRLVPALGQAAPSAESMDALEREALIRLASLARRSGFRYDKTQAVYRLNEPRAMEHFVSKELGGWAEHFEVSAEDDVSLLARGVQEVSLRARIDENEFGNLSVEWVAGFEDDLSGRGGRRSESGAPRFTAAERRRLLGSGNAPLLLPGRGLVRLSERQARASERLSDAMNLFPGGQAPRYLLFSLMGGSDLPVEVSASLQRWRQRVLGGSLLPSGKASGGQGGKHADPAADPSSATSAGAVAGGAVSAAASGAMSASASTVAADSAAASATTDVSGAAGAAAAGGAFALPEFLRPYQRLGVAWMRHLAERGCHGLLADEMGLGKTVQVLSRIASQGKTQKPSLVVCPASVVQVWQSQAAQFFSHLKVRVLGAGRTFATAGVSADAASKASVTGSTDTGSNPAAGEGVVTAAAAAEQEEQPDLWIASYTQLRRHKPLLEQAQFACAVLDEAQFIKNPEAKVTQACLSIRAENRLALTGTPLENRYLDVWTLFRFLMPGLLGTRRRFEEALATDEAKLLLSLRKQLAPFILRRTKTEVASELPEKVELDLVCPLGDLQRKEYRRLLSEGVALYRAAPEHAAAEHGGVDQTATVQSDGAADQSAAGQAGGIDGSAGAALVPAAHTAQKASAGAASGGDSSAEQPATVMSVLTLITRLRQVACDPAMLPWMSSVELHHSGKLNLLRDRLGEVFANGKKAVVFSQFVKFLGRAKEAIALDYPNVPIYELTGTTRNRTAPVERFQSQEGAGVMLVSLRAGGTGITLHAADYVFLLDPWWNPAVEAQAVDRVHRIGQQNRVFVYRMVTAETVEARIAALKQTKRERFEQIMQGASGGDDFREAFRSLESLLGLLQDSGMPESAPDADADSGAQGDSASDNEPTPDNDAASEGRAEAGRQSALAGEAMQAAQR